MPKCINYSWIACNSLSCGCCECNCTCTDKRFTKPSYKPDRKRYYPLRVSTEIFDNSLEIYITRTLSNGRKYKTTFLIDLDHLKDNPKWAIEWLLESVDMALLRAQARIDGQIK